MAVTPKIVLAVAAGFVLVPIAAACGAYTGADFTSIKPGHGKIDYWTWRLMNYWYANTEDGNGLHAILTDGTPYRDTFPAGTPDWVIVACWSGFRNNANNLKRAYRSDAWLPPGVNSVWPTNLVTSY